MEAGLPTATPTAGRTALRLLVIGGEEATRVRASGVAEANPGSRVDVAATYDEGPAARTTASCDAAPGLGVPTAAWTAFLAAGELRGSPRSPSSVRT